MRRKQSNDPGRVRWRLAELLRSKGLVIDAYDLRPALGAYRSSPYHDVHRWDAWCLAGTVSVEHLNNHSMRSYQPDEQIHLTSWDTMTDCIKNGFELSILSGDGPTQVDVSAKDEPKRPSKNSQF